MLNSGPPGFSPLRLYFSSDLFFPREVVSALHSMHPRKPRASKGMGREGRDWEQEKKKRRGESPFPSRPVPVEALGFRGCTQCNFRRHATLFPLRDDSKNSCFKLRDMFLKVGNYM